MKRLFYATGILLLIGSVHVMAQWSLNYSIGTVSGNYTFSYTQVPDPLVEINPPVDAGSTIELSYQWESCSTPAGEFTPLPSGDQSTYTFSEPLVQTIYFRRKVSMNTGTNVIYSNIIKVQVVSANWENINYTRQHDVLIPGMTDWKAVDQLPIGQKMQTTTYQDGFGRNIEAVYKETATPDPGEPEGAWRDLVKFSIYDEYGSQPKQYLNYATNTEPGKFKPSPIPEQAQYYSTNYGETSPYSFTTFDNSPLERVVNAKLPGTSWADHTGKTISYDFNDADDNVQIFTIGYNKDDLPISTGAYSPGTLYKTVHFDENNKMTVVYADKNGRAILTKTQLDESPSPAHGGWICTYSVYDGFGRLRCLIQPEAVKWLEANSWSFSGVTGEKVFKEQCYKYVYDEKGRAIIKRSPGASEQYLLYDSRDRVVFSQDGNQRQKSPGEWFVSLYDALDRTVETGLYSTTKTSSELQVDIDNAVNIISEPGSNQGVNDLVVTSRDPAITQYIAAVSIDFDEGFETLEGDEFEAFIDPNAVQNGGMVVTLGNPISATDMANASKFTPLLYQYYDDYKYDGAKPFDNTFINDLAYSSSDPAVRPISATGRTWSLLTGSRVKVLGTEIFLVSTTYYDEQGMALQVINDNIKSGTDVATNQYNFDGRLLSNDSRHSAPGTILTNFDILTKYIYDKIGRASGVQKKYGNNDFKTISTVERDDVGRVRRRHLDPGFKEGNKDLESLEYSYDINNYITGINKDYALKTPGKYYKWGNYFGLYLGYDNKDNVFADRRLDGHVSGELWTTQGDDAQRKYDYSYDNAGRLIKASYSEKQQPGDNWGNNTMDFSVSGRNGKIEYDLNGNLQFMTQKGVLPGLVTPVMVDDLQYFYFDYSNKLRKTIDNGNLAEANGKLGDFSDGTNANNDDYIYDDNGNLVVDLNKNVNDLPGAANNYGITYNYLDKPEKIHIPGKGTIQLVYDANGKKLQKLYTPENGPEQTVTTYIDEFVYQGNVLKYINFEGGRIRVVTKEQKDNGYDLLNIDGNMDLPGDLKGVYDFFIRDHKENVRMILTEEVHTASSTCTMETDRANYEEPLFGQVDASGNPGADNEVAARFAVAEIPGNSNNEGWQDGRIGSWVSRVGTLVGKTMGPNSLLKVMAGDMISAQALYYYQQPVGNVTTNPILNDMLISLGGALMGNSTTGLVHGAAGNIRSSLSHSLADNTFIDPASVTGQTSIQGPPNAFLYVLFFDERMNFIPENSTRLQVSQSGSGADPLLIYRKKAPKNGYAFVYVCNASDQTVYFDNLQVTDEHGAILEEDHYYLYGLKIAGISSQILPDPHEGSVANKDLFNGKELIDEADLNWYDYGFRNYDPQIGRFVQVDPLGSSFPYLSPFQFAGCEPASNIDMDGLEELPAVTITYYAVAKGVDAVTFGMALARIVPEFLDNFGNNAVIHAYLSEHGFIAWTLEHPGDDICYHNEEWTYLGSAQISHAPTSAEIAAAQEEAIKRIIDPNYGRMMGFIEAAHDMLLSIVYMANTDLEQNTLVKTIMWMEKPDVDKVVDMIDAVSNYDFTDPTNQGRLIFATATVAVPIAAEELVVTETSTVGEEFTTVPTKGRLGNATTRGQIEDIVKELKNRQYTIEGGGGVLPEEYLKPIGGGRKGGSYVDITATHSKYPTLRINTVDTYVSGLPTKRELINAARIRNQIAPGEHLLLIPKSKL